MTEPIPNNPKLFISYSWSNPDHQQWVMDLATRLVESGVDAVLDKWDLKEGHDTISFMERMVTSDEIKKVIMICDETYARKADGRDGGVGTETQIISRKVYENESQDKFVAVLSSRDSEGKPYLPTYYQSRIFIDLSNDDRYDDEFEKLLRWIFDKPLHKRPELGRRPSFLDDNDKVSLGTTALHHRCMEAMRQGKPHAAGAVDEYFQTFAENLSRFRLSGTSVAQFDEEVLKSIELMRPYRDEALSIVRGICQYMPTVEMAEKVHRFLERIDRHTEPPENVNSYTDWDCDNIKFFITEFFLNTQAHFIKSENFQLAATLFDRPYYLQRRFSSTPDGMHTFASFCFQIASLDARNNRLGLRRYSPEADLIKERCSSPTLDFRDVMQADFVACLRHAVLGNLAGHLWWPNTLVYVGHPARPFEIFSRSVQRSYFDKMKVVLGVESISQFSELVDQLTGDRNAPRIGRMPLDVAGLTNRDKMCSIA